MAKRGYWLDLFTGTTWKELIEAGGSISGFSESRWNIVQKVRVGDYLLCYLTGICLKFSKRRIRTIPN
jgi:hypothetical protein